MPAQRTTPRVTELDEAPTATEEDGAGESSRDRAAEGDQLRDIFVAYCSFGDAMNMTDLSAEKFLKLLRDCKVIDNSTHSGQTYIVLPTRSHILPLFWGGAKCWHQYWPEQVQYGELTSILRSHGLARAAARCFPLHRRFRRRFGW